MQSWYTQAGTTYAVINRMRNIIRSVSSQKGSNSNTRPGVSFLFKGQMAKQHWLGKDLPEAKPNIKQGGHGCHWKDPKF